MLEEYNPKIVVIELGGNDALRGYPIASIQDNLTNMSEIAKNSGCIVLLVEMRIPPNYGIRYTNAFAKIFANVAHSTDIRLVPFILEDVALDRTLMQDDGIHPSAKAQPILLNAIWPILKKAIADSS
mgnify:FL=1